MIEELISLSHRFLEVKNASSRRYFIRTTPLDHRLIMLMGPRGVGKTTTLVQALLDVVEGNPLDPRILYIQSDHFLMGTISLYEVADYFHTLGGQWIVFDEIHKYPNWSQELKSIYDTFPKLKIWASGSSALEIHKGSHDLSRRGVVYTMQGMSFREHLELTHQMELPCYTLKEICTKHESLSRKILQELDKREHKIVSEFHRYLKTGYYPYFLELSNTSLYRMTLEQNVHTTIEADLSAIYPQLTGVSVQKMKRLLSFIANEVPFTPQWSKIQAALEIGDLRTLKAYFSHLEDAGLIRSLHIASQKFRQLGTPSKIYLENPNQLYAISAKAPEKGTVRETFFLNTVSHKHAVNLPNAGDFLVDSEYLFEVGGKNKSFTQVKDHKNSYLVCDEIEQGAKRKIPLWLFGFLY